MGLFKRRPRHSAADPQPEEEVPKPTLPDPPQPVDSKGRRALADQRDYLLSLVEPLPAFGMYLLDAWGTAVCEDIQADTNLPLDDLVAVAGYAVHSEELKALEPGERTTLVLRDDDRVAKVGSAVPVKAGQPLPEGADAVVPLERATRDGSVITVSHPVASGDFVRWSGSEVQAGVPLLRNGERLDARRSALLALAGIDRVLARPRPRVVVISVADPDSDPSDVDSHLLAAVSKSDGAQVWRVGLAPGDDRELQDAVSDQMIRADILIASGDLGEEAQLPRVVGQMGLLDMADIAAWPGGRMGFALVGEDQIPLVLLPDDSVSAYIGYQSFVRPLLRKLMGLPVVNRNRVSCLSGGDLVSKSGQIELRFGAIRDQQGEQVVVPLGRADNPKLADLVSADALILLDEQTTKVSLGDRVDCWLLAD